MIPLPPFPVPVEPVPFPYDNEEIRLRPGGVLQPPQCLGPHFPLQAFFVCGGGFFFLRLQLGVVIYGLLCLLQLVFQLCKAFLRKLLFQPLVRRQAVRSVLPIGEAVLRSTQQAVIVPFCRHDFTSRKSFFLFFKNSSDLPLKFLLLVKE